MKSLGVVLGVAGAIFLGSASPQVLADSRLRKEVDSETLVHRSNQSVFKNVQLEAKWYEVTIRHVLKDVEFEEYVCDEEASSPGNWHGFYTLPREHKAQALAQAIGGMDLDTARLVVNARQNYFGSKPKTWNSFKSKIRRIEADFYMIGLYYQVVGEHGQTNVSNLGYSHFGYGCGWESRVVKAEVPIEDKRVLKTFPLEVDVFVNNAILLEGEAEEITVIWDGETLDVAIPRAFNHYEEPVISADGIVTIEGLSRKAVAPSSGDFNFSILKDDGRLYFNVRDSRYEELSAISGSYDLSISFKVVRGAKGCFRGEKTLASESVTIPASGERIDLTDVLSRRADPEDSFEAGVKYFVDQIQIERIGVDYFRGATPSLKTAPIEF